MRPLIAVGVLAAACIGALATWAGQDPAFPHLTHERLFPVCEGCHAGQLTGEADDMFPQRADCDRCHDGIRAERVDWQPRDARATNLRFSHPQHLDLTTRSGEPVVCRECHAAEGEPSRMNVGLAQPERCIACHEHAAASHLEASLQCGRCHVPLANAGGLSLQRVARLPQPPDHAAPGFMDAHGAAADATSCSVCHARESCERCHANADRVGLIAALAPDPRVAALSAGRAPAYPRPVSHDRDWAVTHGAAAGAEAQHCSNCHTQSSCAGCHLTGNAVIAELPATTPGAATGVVVASRVHALDVTVRHGGLAATGRLDCSRCHTRETCASCHAGSDSRAFHLPNFVERHAADVFAAGSDCQSCHNTETFCRNCHMRTGVASEAGMSAAFHTGQPMWVLSHGQAARTGMESCASCHRQSDCIRCHSAAGGWGVNPHGAGFDARRLASRNAATCRWCHFSDPFGR
jgi:hypothetical protein